MLTRLLIVVLCVAVALPAVVLMPSASAAPHPWNETVLDLAAKGKRKKKPRFTTVTRPVTRTVTRPVTRTVREVVTRVFSNSTSIVIPDSGKANPYPAPIVVSGFANGVITDVNLTLHGFGHTVPDDVDILLAAGHLPTLNAIVMSDSGGFFVSVSNLNITLDDQATADLPTSEGLATGAFRPTNNIGLDTFPDAPVPTRSSALGVFNGSNPNGTWQLFVVDSTSNGSGTLDGGWSLTISAQVDTQITEQVTEEITEQVTEQVPLAPKKKRENKKK